MTEDELRQIVRSPSIRRVRRFFSKSVGLGALQQLGCVEEVRGLEKLEVVCCSSSKEEAARRRGSFGGGAPDISVRADATRRAHTEVPHVQGALRPTRAPP